MRNSIRLVILLAASMTVVSLTSGCGSLGKSLKAFMGGKSEEQLAEDERRKMGPRFSDTENMRFRGPQRQYKRMNRQRFEDESEVHSGAGSLWVMEGQGAYLFTQNTTRMVGDLLNVNIEGGPKTQLSTKVRVISKLLERIDRPSPPPAVRAPAGQAGAKEGAAAPAEGENPQPPAPGAAQATAAAGPPAEKAEPPFAVQTVPTRVVEILRDGNYRVKGSETFMIGKREYRVIVTGIVRPEDFNDEGVSAAKLLDPQFDIVSSRRGGGTTL